MDRTSQRVDQDAEMRRECAKITKAIKANVRETVGMFHTLDSMELNRVEVAYLSEIRTWMFECFRDVFVAQNQ